MTQYIDKSALVAEIEKKYETNIIGAHSAFRNGKIEALREVKTLINTLEVKDIDEIIKNAEDHAYFAGCENTRVKLIDKACEWLKSYRQDTYDGTSYIAGIVNDKTIEDFRKAMEE